MKIKKKQPKIKYTKDVKFDKTNLLKISAQS